MDLRKGITSFIVVTAIIAGLLVLIASNAVMHSRLVEADQAVFLEMKAKQVKKDILHSFESVVYSTLSNQLLTEPGLERIALAEKILCLEQELEKKYSGAVEVDLWVKKQTGAGYFSSGANPKSYGNATALQKHLIKKSDIEKIIAVRNHSLKSYLLAFVDNKELALKILELGEEKKISNPVAQEFVLAEHKGLVLGATITAKSGSSTLTKTVIFPTGYTLVVKKTALQLIEELVL